MNRQALAAMLPGVVARLEEVEKRRAAALESADAGFFRDAAHGWFLRAMLDEPKSIAAHLRKGLAEIRTAFEVGLESHAWKMWDYVSYALAAGDAESAHFLAAVPEEAWCRARIKPVPWLVVQVRASFALFREEPAGALLEELQVLVAEEPLPPELEPDLPVIRSDAALLRAIHDRSAAEFNRLLKERMELRRDRGLAPASIYDFAALGLCRLARDRGISPAVRHAALPLEVLG
jgi:hypothetical protein